MNENIGNNSEPKNPDSSIQPGMDLSLGRPQVNGQAESEETDSVKFGELSRNNLIFPEERMDFRDFFMPFCAGLIGGSVSGFLGPLAFIGGHLDLYGFFLILTATLGGVVGMMIGGPAGAMCAALNSAPRNRERSNGLRNAMAACVFLASVGVAGLLMIKLLAHYIAF